MLGYNLLKPHRSCVNRPLQLTDNVYSAYVSVVLSAVWIHFDKKKFKKKLKNFRTGMFDEMMSQELQKSTVINNNNNNQNNNITNINNNSDMMLEMNATPKNKNKKKNKKKNKFQSESDSEYNHLQHQQQYYINNNSEANNDDLLLHNNNILN